MALWLHITSQNWRGHGGLRHRQKSRRNRAFGEWEAAALPPLWQLSTDRKKIWVENHHANEVYVAWFVLQIFGIMYDVPSWMHSLFFCIPWSLITSMDSCWGLFSPSVISWKEENWQWQWFCICHFFFKKWLKLQTKLELPYSAVMNFTVVCVSSAILFFSHLTWALTPSPLNVVTTRCCQDDSCRMDSLP